MTSTGLEALPQAPRATVSALGEVTRLFRALHAHQVRYCHWKSNQHLRASMMGDTDLDVLVDRRHLAALRRALSQTNFKPVVTPLLRGYPAIESFLSLDEPTGQLIHLHLHYQLTVGEKHLKGYRLDWEETLLASRILDPDEGVYVADPNVEILLLFLRTVLKLRIRDVVRGTLRGTALSSDVLRELHWLRPRTDADALNRFARPWLGEHAANQLHRLVAAPVPSLRQLSGFRASIQPPLSQYRTYFPASARLRRWYRQGHKLFATVLWHRSGVLLPTRRQPIAGGIIVVFVGPDGSGKSTLARESTRWLSSLMDVLPIYFGSGQGPVSLPRRLLQSVAALVRRFSGSRGEPMPGPRRGRGTSTLRTAGEVLWVWALSRERRRRAAQARRARNRGMVVLCDRFPLSNAVGNDGPCLGHWLNDRSWIRRRVAREELEAIQSVEQLRPDLVIKLAVTPEIALQRKPDTPRDLLAIKLRVLEQVEFSDRTRVVEIDATRPLSEVLLEVKRVLWNVV